MALQYQYQPLSHDDETRLLYLEPGSGDDVCFRLQSVRLRDKPAYEAISYCWGDADDTREVQCEGRPLHITNSLYTAFRRLRKDDAVRVLWADAVCINQHDIADKNRQVQLMSRIYSQPSRILIWLGDDTSEIEGLHECLKVADELLPPEFYEIEELYPVLKNMLREAAQLRREEKPNFNDHDWRPIINVITRPWFDRRWIIQEVALADESVPRLAMCGDIEFDWNDLASVTYRLGVYGIVPLLAGLSTVNYYAPYMVSFLADDGKAITMLFTAFVSYLLKIYRKKMDIFDCVTATALFKCTDPRDHLYSLLSVTPNCSGLVADYALSTEQVCTKLAVTILVSDQNLKLLSLAPSTSILPDGQPPKRLALPTWVPDLTCQGVVNPLVSYTIRPQLFHAGGREKPGARVSPDGKLLHVRGRVVDKVAAMARCTIDIPFPTEEEVHPKSGFHARMKKRMLNWIEDCCEVAGERYWKKSNAAVVEVVPPKRGYWEFLTCGLAGTKQKQKPATQEESTEEAELRRGFLETLLCGMTMLRDPIPDEVLAATQVYVDYLFEFFSPNFELSEDVRVTMLTYGVIIEQSLLGVTESRRFCRTKQGRLGQVRAEAKEGDLFVCIVGAEVPFVLRPSAEKEGIYTLIGDAFLLGVMQGEAFSDPRYETIDIAIE